MRTAAIVATDLRAVFAVPPLARRRDTDRSLDFAINDNLVRHIVNGGITRLMYGGNAFLYHMTLDEYDALLAWLTDLPSDVWAIPSLGPSYGRAIDQARRLRTRGFPTAMLLPCNDPRDAAGLERGVREIAEAADMPLILYLKEEQTFGQERDAGLDAIGRLVAQGLVIAIKYAVVRSDPEDDPYLVDLLRRVDGSHVISGIGERPAVAHLRRYGLPGFTTGSGCVAPGLSQAILEACHRRDWELAEAHRAAFLPLEDLRDSWGPARVLHAVVTVIGAGDPGPIPPYVSELPDAQREHAQRAAAALLLRATQASSLTT